MSTITMAAITKIHPSIDRDSDGDLGGARDRRRLHRVARRPDGVLDVLPDLTARCNGIVQDGPRGVDHDPRRVDDDIARRDHGGGAVAKDGVGSADDIGPGLGRGSYDLLRDGRALRGGSVLHFYVSLQSSPRYEGSGLYPPLAGIEGLRTN